MSAASSVPPQVRRNAAAVPSRAAQPATAQTSAPERQITRVFDFSKPRGEDEIRVNLADLPLVRNSLEADVFAPTLLSRLFDLFGPRR